MFDGTFRGKAALVWRRPRTANSAFGEVEQWLQELGSVCENVARPLCLEQTAQFLLSPFVSQMVPLSLWLERRQQSSLGDEYEFCGMGNVERNLMLGIGRGLSFLHAFGVRFTNLSPDTVFVDAVGQPKLVRFDEARFVRQPADAGAGPGTTTTFMAPEVLLFKPGAACITAKADSFSYGVLLWHVLLGGHPFGATEEEQRRNMTSITVFRPNVTALLRVKPEVAWLMESLLPRQAEKRYTAEQIVQHPALWSAQQWLLFVNEVMAFVHTSNKQDEFDQEAQQRQFARGDWSAALDGALVDALDALSDGVQAYRTDRLSDLGRLVLNLSLHIDKQPLEVRAVLGAYPDGFVAYFARRFPAFFLATYCFATRECITRTNFLPFFINHTPCSTLFG